MNRTIEKTIEESVARLISRAADSRGLQIGDLQPRITLSLGKYLFRDNENASAADVKNFIDELSADDLCLIIACEKGIEAAWEDLVKGFDSTVKAAAWRFAKSAEQAEDLAGSIWAELYGLKRDADGKLKTKLSHYSGRGTLKGWLRAVTSQLAVDEYRIKSKFVQIEEAREFENLAHGFAEKNETAPIVSRSENPEEALNLKETQKDVSQALTQAVGELEAEDKLLLKLYYRDKIKLKDIGASFGFHEATASRKLFRIQTEIRKSVEKILQTQHGWRQEEVKRHLAEAASKLGISFDKLMAILLFAALVQETFWRSVL